MQCCDLPSYTKPDMTPKHTAPPAAQEPAFKRRRTNNPSGPTEPALSLDPELSYSHRKSLSSRASLSNAADNFHFSKRRALVFNFVDVFDIVEDSLGKLKSCTLRCGICRRGNGWRWIPGGKTKGSTSNMIGHMKDKHPLLWNNALRADMIAWGKELEEQSSNDLSPQTLVPLADEPVRNYLIFKPSRFTDCMRIY